MKTAKNGSRTDRIYGNRKMNREIYWCYKVSIIGHCIEAAVF